MSREQDQGTSALEYGLMIAAIAGVLVAVVFSLGSALHDNLENSRDCFSKQLNTRPC